MAHLRPTPRLLVLSLAISAAVYILLVLPSEQPRLAAKTAATASSLLPDFVKDRWPSTTPPNDSSHHDATTFDNRSLTETQCRAAFPGLLREIDLAVRQGPFDLEPNNADGIGPLQAQIRDGRLWILNAPRKSELSQDMREVSSRVPQFQRSPVSRSQIHP